MIMLQKLAPKLAVSMMRQSAAGGSHLHDKRIAHRDIRAANLLVYSEAPFRLKLADFGFSCVLDIGPDGQPKSYVRTKLKMPTSTSTVTVCMLL